MRNDELARGEGLDLNNVKLLALWAERGRMRIIG